MQGRGGEGAAPAAWWEASGPHGAEDEVGWAIRQAEALGVPLSRAQAVALARFTDLLQEAQARVNVTAVRQRRDVWVRHHLDSLSAAGLVDPEEAALALDVGSGGGLPGIPLAIVRPRLTVVLIESVHRKAAFLDSAVRALGLGNVQVVCERAEAMAHRPEWRGRADWAFIRAVGSLALSAELCGPLVRRGGRVVVMKGPAVSAEWEDGVAHARRGGLEVVERRELKLPGDLQRVLVVFLRSGDPPASWPRRPGRLGRV